jgi:hypothetical protein
MGVVRIVLGLVLLCGACGGDSTRGVHTVHGDLTLGGETRLFRPCGSDERWHLALEPYGDAGAITEWDAYQQATVPRCPDGAASCGITGVYVEGVARVTARGSYGPLGMYDRELQFVSLDRALGTAPAGCAVSTRPL